MTTPTPEAWEKEFDGFVLGEYPEEVAEAIRSHIKTIVRRLLLSERQKIGEKVSELLGYCEHTRNCILAHSSAGRPTEDGGYEVEYRDKWYRTRPVNETPKCECGLDKLADALINQENNQ